jgi:integrase
VATLYQRGDCWYLNWREAGRQVRISLGKIDARAAEKVRREKEAQLTLGIEAPPDVPSLAEWIDDYCEWQEEEHGTKKRKYELKHARAALGHLSIATLPPQMVEAHKMDRLRVAKPETVGKEIRILKAAMNRAVELKVIKENPIAKFKPPRGVTSKAVQFFTKKQLAALYKADRSLAPIWRFMVNTGMRRAEFSKALRSDVKGDVILIESTDAGRTKSARWREVPLNKDAKASLRALGRDRLTTFAVDTLSHKFAKAARAAKVSGNLHMLRHTFCSYLVMAGVSLRAVQVMAGHSSYAITEKYAHLAKSNKAEAVNLISL